MSKRLFSLVLFCFSMLSMQAQQVQINAKKQIEVNAKTTSISFEKKTELQEQVHTYDLYEFDLVQLRSAVKASAFSEVVFKLPGKKDIQFSLQENELRTANYKAIAMTEQGAVEVPRGPCISYKGFNAADGIVRMTITDELIYGMTMIDGKEFHIRSLYTLVQGTPKQVVIAYYLSDVIDTGMICPNTGDYESPAGEMNLEEKADNNSNECSFIEFATEADAEQFAGFGTAAATNAFAIASLNIAEVTYQEHFNVNFQVNFQSVWTVAPFLDPYDETAPKFVVQQLVNTWETFAAFTAEARDYVIFFTGKETPGALGRVAHIGAMCTHPDLSYAYVQPAATGTVALAHEIGHGLGATHFAATNCGQNSGNKSIMCANAINSTTSFSNSNQKKIRKTLNTTSCLFNNYGESFEGGIANWTQATNDDMDWSTGVGTTPTANTGPTTAYQGNVYLMLEASGNNGNTARITSPDYSVCSQKDYLSFGYHMRGSDMGSLQVQISTDMGATFTTIWSASGDHGDLWYTAGINLDAFVGSVVIVRINGTVGDGNESDIAIDDLTFSSACNIDLSQNFVVLPHTGGSESIYVAMTSSWEAHRQLSVSWLSMQVVGSNIMIHAQPNTTAAGRMTSVLVSCGPTVKSITIVQGGDFPVINTEPCGVPYYGLPNTQGFEGNFANGWTQDPDDDFDWERNSGSTPTQYTGPENAAEGQFYLYTEASDNFNNVANYVSPCFDLADVPDPQITFDYHMRDDVAIGSQTHMGTLKVQVSQTGGYNWITIFERSGAQGNVWHNETLDLSSYTGNPMQIRFNATTGSSWRSDIAIDGISVESGACYDQYENNNTFSTAFATTIGNTITHSNACLSAGDQDYYKFFYSGAEGFTSFAVRVEGKTSSTTGDYQLRVDKSGKSITVETLPQNGSTTDTYIYVYNHTGGWIAQNDNGGQGNFSKVTTTLPSAPVFGSTKANVSGFELTNYPNPFSDQTTFAFSLAQEDKVSLSIRDLSGRLVAMPIAETTYSSGQHLVEFQTDQLPAGVYNYFLKTSQSVESRQMVIIR